jgi:phosphopantetheine--protein transferase-like protein
MSQGIDTVEISRIEKLIAEDSASGSLARFFSEAELADAGSGASQAQKLAARFAAKEACVKLFPKETCLGQLEPVDFSVSKDNYGAPHIVPNARARAVMDLHRVAAIEVSLTHTENSATAIAATVPNPITAPWYGKVFYRIAPWRRRVVLANMRRVYGATLSDSDITRLAEAFYGHLLLCLVEFIKMPFLSAKRRAGLIRIEGGEHLEAARALGKGVLLLTGHFGNWEVATVAGIAQFKEYQGLFHFIRRPLKPQWFNDFVMRRFRKAGFGTIDKAGTLDDILDLLENNEIVVSIFDQFTFWRFGIPSEFFGHRVLAFKSLAILAQATGAPVVPSSSWREPDGSHVLKFDAPLALSEGGRSRDLSIKNTRIFNETIERIILRHPEQWIWMHQRWRWKKEWDSLLP